jgi:hypothetical protein
MNILNVHERALPVAVGEAIALIDGLSSTADRLSPAKAWPPMRLDRPLGVGARGGHGPIRYFVEAYEPGRSVLFRFTGPPGFDGTHGFELLEDPVRLRHTLAMRARGRAMLTWPLLFRPLHDAVLEDSLAMAEASLGLQPRFVPWTPRVRFLRWLTSGGKSPPQSVLAVR